MFLKIGGQLHNFLGSLGGKKYPKMPKNPKTVLKYDLCSLDTLRNHLSINSIFSMF